MPYEAKTNWKYDDTVTEKDLNRIEQGLKDAHVAEYKDITLKPGVQIVDVPEDTPFRMGEIRGRTLINLLGYAGACESDSNGDGFPDGWYIVNGLASDMALVEGNTGKGFFAKSAHAKDRRISGFPFRDYGAEGHTHLLLVAVMKPANGGISLQVVEKDDTEEKIITNAPMLTDTTKFNLVHMRFPVKSGNSYRIDLTGNGQWNGGIIDDVRLYSITEAEYNAIGSMTIEQVAARYPYVDSMTNVANPYAIGTSGNLLPPFTQWSHINTKGKIAGRYEYHSEMEPVGIWTHVDIDVLPNTDYTLSFEGTDGIRMRITDVGEAVTVLPLTANGGGFYSGNLQKVRVFIVAEVGVVKNPIVLQGNHSLPIPFTPQSRSIWAAECQLAANPVDGTNADVLFKGDDGLPYVQESWKKSIITGLEAWELSTKSSEIKQVRVPNYFPIDAVSKSIAQMFGVKYDGTRLIPDYHVITSDTFILQPGTGYLYVGISNKDSGWGDKYNPSADEIKAYFMGWRMYDKSLGATSVYNRADGLNKSWAYRHPLGADGLTGGTETLPTTQAPITTTWQPYRLQYLKAKPTAEPASKYETGLTLSKGWNMVEVGGGVVLREKANPTYYSPNGNYYINNTAVSGSLLKNKVLLISRVYRNNQIDNTAKVENDTNAYGKQHVRFLPSDFDPTAVYHVTYTMLDPTLTATISGSIAANLSGTVTDMVAWASDAERRLSVVETQKAEKDNAVAWITPTLLNDWKPYNDGYVNPRYYKDENGVVHLEGLIKDGLIAQSTSLFLLPTGYRPKGTLIFYVIGVEPGGVPRGVRIDVTAGGRVIITQNDNNYTNAYLSINNISFLAEQ
ncbi:hypothetical protein M3661_08795 [Paenibacillus sp. MER 180]|uniref:hypothetical protein n=1 Tax=Paenibacillus sp. MER 180 TaxID=2939570 RepID=UPI00203DDBE6|nr:hypothetical protein [Paenibacillus sp. MER 180]MCM3290224.1 hypothetical protein [Paenibacillus sp. MER 180]